MVLATFLHPAAALDLTRRTCPPCRTKPRFVALRKNGRSSRGRLFSSIVHRLQFVVGGGQPGERDHQQITTYRAKDVVGWVKNKINLLRENGQEAPPSRGG